MEPQDIYLEPKEDKMVFLKKNDLHSANEIIEIINSSKSSNLSDADLQIIKEIKSNLINSKQLPGWWSDQESFYIRNNRSSNLLLEYIAFRYKFKRFPVEKIRTDFPLYVLIEPVSSCNLRCPFCFQMDKEFNRKPYAGIMDLSLFKRVVDECEKNGAKAITLASRGEPTLHPKLPEMLDYLKDKFLEIKLNTNGTRLNDELCHEIYKSGVNDVVLSIDSEKKELFEQLRKNATFEEVVENVKNLRRIRDQYYPDSKTIIRISGVKFLPEQNNDKFMNFWKSIADEISISSCEERWDTYNNDVKSDFFEPCTLLWERFYVWFDGTCNPCDVDYKSKLSPGKLSTHNSIRSIWNSKEYNNIRLLHIERSRNNLNPCDRCGVY